MVGQGAIGFSNVEDVLIENNQIHENQRNVGILAGGNNIVISSNFVSRNSRQGIWFMGAHNSQIVHNTVTDIRGSHANGISVYLGSSNILVAGNQVYNAPSPFTFQASHNLTIFNNVFDGGDGSNNVNEWGDDSTGVVAFLNNTLARNDRNAALNMGNGGADPYIIKNNVIDGMCPNFAVSDLSHNIYTGLEWCQDIEDFQEGEFLEEDLNTIFVDPANGDFRLKENSPAIDTGVDITPHLPTDTFPDFDFGTDITGILRPQGSTWDIGAYEFLPTLALSGAPADQTIYLNWTVNTTLPVTSTWQINYQGQGGTLYMPITGIISPTRAYTLTGLTNYVWYTVTLNAMLDSAPLLTDTVTVMPTGIFVYLPVVLKGL